MIPKFDPKWPLHFLLLWRHNDKKMLENVQILNLLEINFHLGHITLVYLNYNKSYELFPKVSILGPLWDISQPPSRAYGRTVPSFPTNGPRVVRRQPQQSWTHKCVQAWKNLKNTNLGIFNMLCFLEAQVGAEYFYFPILTRPKAI